MVRAKSALLASFLAFMVVGAYMASAGNAAAAEETSRFDPATHADNASYCLGTGDKARVIVFDEEDLGGEFQIDDAGYIRLPLIGPLKAAGYSPRDLETRIASALGDGYLNAPRVSVEVTDYRPFYIMGEVNKPGQYADVNDMTAMNAVVLGGGYTIKARDSSVYIRHEGEKEEREFPADATTKIHPGDVVRVPPTAFWAAITFAGPISAIVSTRWYLPQPPQ